MSALEAICDQFGIDRAGLPVAAGSCRGACLVVGSSRDVWLEVGDTNRWRESAVLAVNDMIMYWPTRLHHAYSNDWRFINGWCELRRPLWIDRGDQGVRPLRHCFRPAGNATVWPWPGTGTSGLNAVFTAVGLGYDPVIVAGMAMDDSGHFFDPPGKWTNYGHERRFWVNCAEALRGTVYGLSGFVKDLLRPPPCG